MLTANAKLVPTTGTLQFWRTQDITSLDYVIPIIRGEERDQRSDWPGGNFPSWTEIKAELSASRSAYVSVKPIDDGAGFFLNFLVGRYMVLTRCKRGQGGQGILRISLNSSGIKFANNGQRRNMVVQGVRITHKGLALTSFDDFYRDFSDRSSLYSLGQYANQLVALESKQSPEVSKGRPRGDDEGEAAVPLLETEEHLLRTLETYVDAEHFLEEQAVRATAGFAFIEVTPEKRVASVRKYFRLKLLESDYKRLKAEAPGMLALERAENERPLQLRVDDLAPNGGRHQIVVSTGEQLATGMIPESGNLVLFANPIQKNVRMQVIETLRQRMSSNQWLLPLAAQNYRHGPSAHVPVPIPASGKAPNASQQLAINKGAGTEDYLLVLGPPGTGKTTVILRWVEYFVAKNKRVLISSQNNKAVDNVFERLAENRSLTCVRLGSEGAVSSTVHDLLIDNCASSLQRKLIESIEQHMTVLSEFERVCTLTSAAGDASSKDMDAFVAGLDQLQSALTTQLKVMTAFIEMCCSGAEVFQTGILHASLRRLTEIPAEIEQFKENQKRQSLRIAEHRESELAKIADEARKDIEQLEAAHQTNSDGLRLRERQLAEKGGLFKPIYRVAGWWLARQQKAALAALERNLAQVAERKAERSHAAAKEADANLSRAQAEHDVNLDKIKIEQTAVHVAIESATKTKLPRLKALTESLSRLLAETSAWHDTIANQRQEGLYSILLNFVDVVGATCIGINTNKFFKEALFDIVIVDESGQIQLHNLSVPLSRAPKAILVGDHKQLPPVVQDELIDEIIARAEADSADIDTELMRKSWFELLWDSAPDDRKVMLDTQFRCPAVISDYISAEFYQNKYFAGAGMAEKKPLFSFFTSPMVFIDTSELPIDIRQESSRRGPERDELIGNAVETQLVLEMLARALDASPKLGEKREMGVIVPYKLHVQEIQREISSRQRVGELRGLPSPINELVASVDSYQGQERDLIVFTFTRSNPRGAVGFLADWRRLNVAMTRAKRQLVMIGDFSTLAKPPKPGSRDAEFKRAMMRLRSFVSKNGQLIRASDWLPALTKPAEA